MSVDNAESESERLNRNWSELLQEIRVVQTGSQILTGFLLTIAFQPTFDSLDRFQVTLYMCLIFAAAATTVAGLAPVSLHRRLFRKREKDRVVEVADVFVKATMAGVAIVLAGTLTLITDIVVGRTAGFIAAGVCIVSLFTVWLLIPSTVRRRGE
jgi:hypothetical protein